MKASTPPQAGCAADRRVRREGLDRAAVASMRHHCWRDRALRACFAWSFLASLIGALVTADAASANESAEQSSGPGRSGAQRAEAAEPTASAGSKGSSPSGPGNEQAEHDFDPTFAGVTIFADVGPYEEKRYKKGPVALRSTCPEGLSGLGAMLRKHTPDDLRLFTKSTARDVTLVMPTDISQAEADAFRAGVRNELDAQGVRVANIKEIALDATGINEADRRAKKARGEEDEELSDEQKLRKAERIELMPRGRWLLDEMVKPQARTIARATNVATLGERTKAFWSAARIDPKVQMRRRANLIGYGKTAVALATWLTTLSFPANIFALVASLTADQIFTVFGPEIQEWKQKATFPGTEAFRLARMGTVEAGVVIGEERVEGRLSKDQAIERMKRTFGFTEKEWDEIQKYKAVVWDENRGGIRIDVKPYRRMVTKLVKKLRKERKAGMHDGDEPTPDLAFRRKLRKFDEAAAVLPVHYSRRTPLKAAAAWLNGVPFLQTLLGDQIIGLSTNMLFRTLAFWGGATPDPVWSLAFWKFYGFGLPGTFIGGMGGWAALALRKIGAITPRTEHWLYMLYGTMFALNGLLLPLGSSFFYTAVMAEWAVNFAVFLYYGVHRLIKEPATNRLVFAHPKFSGKALFAAGYETRMLRQATELVSELSSATDPKQAIMFRHEHRLRNDVSAKERAKAKAYDTPYNGVFGGEATHAHESATRPKSRFRRAWHWARNFARERFSRARARTAESTTQDRERRSSRRPRWRAWATGERTAEHATAGAF